MKKSVLFASAMMLLAATACNKEIQGDNPTPEAKPQVELSFNASLTAPTKTEIGASETVEGVLEHKVYWSVGDKIQVYASGGDQEGVEFSTNITEASSTAIFTGTIGLDENYYAFYPSSAGAKWYNSDSYFGFTLKPSQKANGIASGFALSKAEDNAFQFDHVTGYVKFTIPQEYDGDIIEVSFLGNNSEVLAGYQKYYPNDISKNDYPMSNSKYVKLILSPSMGETFSAGTYYFVSYPAEFNDGITMIFTNKEGETATKISSTPIKISAGEILNVGTVANLSYESVIKQSLPWTEDFSGEDLSDYSTVGEVSVDASGNYATGVKPELYLKGEASFSANIDVKNAERNLTLTYKTNNNKNSLTVSEGASLSDQISNDKTVLYNITLNDDVEVITLKWTSTANSRLDDISLLEGTYAFQTLSFDQTTITAILGEEFTAPQLTGANTSVTYSSSDQNVAMVDNSGNVTILAKGRSVITATAAAENNYFAASASYTIDVIEPLQDGVKQIKVTVTSKSTVSTEGELPDGASVDYSQTYNTMCQMTKGNSVTYTLKGFSGYTITAVTLSMKSNKSGGAGNLSLKAGEESLATIETAAFNTPSWNGSYSQEYVDIPLTLTNSSYVIKSGENVVLHIAATVNSIYCQSVTIQYEKANL